MIGWGEAERERFAARPVGERDHEDLKASSPAFLRRRVAAAKAFYEALWWVDLFTADPFAEATLPKLTEKPVERGAG